MIEIPEIVKDLFRSDNESKETSKNIKLRFYDQKSPVFLPNNTAVWLKDSLPIDAEPILTIYNRQISTESLSIIESICDSENVVFGQCNSAIVEIMVADVMLDVSGKEFLLSIEIGDYEIAMGFYRVESFVRQADRRMRKITAYDRMQMFNKDVAVWYNSLSFPMTIKQFRTSLCDHIGVDAVEIELPLDNMYVSKTIDPQQLYALDVLERICEINGCFGSMEKTGRLKYISLSVSSLFPAEDLYPSDDLYPAELLNAEHLSRYRQSETTYEDYVVYGINKVQIRQEEGDIGATYGDGDNGYIIQGNFLVFGKNANELLQIASVIFGQISGKMYRPSKIKCNALPWVEVGDGIVCYTTDDIIETYCLKRTTNGIQGMMDTYESSGSKRQQEPVGIQSQIIQIEGKAAVIKKSVDEVSVVLTDLKKNTEAQFSVVADQILAEVKRAQDSEASLKVLADNISLSVINLKDSTDSQIKVMSDNISLKVSKGDVSSQISVESDGISIVGDRFSWSSTYSKMTDTGKLWCQGLEAVDGYFTGTLKTDMFYSDNEVVKVGGFESRFAWGRDILQSYDEVTGMSAEPYDSGKLYLWAGYYDETDFAFLVNNEKQTHAKNLWLGEWLESDLQEVEERFPSNQKLNLSSFSEWTVNRMILDRYQWGNWLIEVLANRFNVIYDMINEIDDRLSNLGG